jgi:N-acetylglucosaminyl-diphospho-decaprenol L-rhamnosyltransferase
LKSNFTQTNFSRSSAQSLKTKVDLFVLNYNGATFILDTIESLTKASKHSQNECQIIVIDNASTDDSVNIICERFSHIEIFQMAENRVLCAFNDAVRASKANIVFLLNSDLKVQTDFIDPMVDVFNRKEDVFLVGGKSFLLDETYEGGLSIPLMRYGMFGTSCNFQGHEHFLHSRKHTFSVGFGAYDRSKFLELGGFDDLYLPGRLEDADISFRAWRKGWLSYFEPKSVLYHAGAKSFKARFGVRGTREIAYRNTYLFMWKNIFDTKFWIAHWVFFLPRLFWMLIKGQPEYATALIKSFGRLRLALKRRRDEKRKKYKLTDREVFNQFKHAN